MKEELTFREASRFDIDELYFLERDIFSDAWSREPLESQISDTATRGILLSLNREEIVAYICYYFVADSVHIARVAVKKNHRCKGYGISILDELVSSLKAKGAKEFSLEVRKSNEAAIGLYEKAGFVNLGERKNYYPDGETGIMMGIL